MLILSLLYLPTILYYRLCCTCGIPIPSNPSNMCLPCIKEQVDLTEGITKQLTIHYCSGCEQYLQPPNIWIRAGLETKELMALILKRMKGLNKVKLVDAAFTWTEPHSKRIRLKLTIQKEVMHLKQYIACTFTT